MCKGKIMSNSYIKGIHHITAIAGDPQQNVDFYSGVLGLRMVKKTVNFDAPDTYHFYYGDNTGSPGSVLTFFPWGEGTWKGRAGTGQVSVISFNISNNSIDYWMERLQLADLSIQGPHSRFNEQVISFRDPDGIQLELVSTDQSDFVPWQEGPVPAEMAIRGFYSATLAVRNHQETAKFLTESFGYTFKESSGNRFRYSNSGKKLGSVVDLLELPDGPEGRMGAGAIHHIAWRIPDDEKQLEKREELIERGYQITPVMDRNYFHSIYFREPGNILFEIATDTPGFLIDESIEELGKNLKLPQWLEKKRSDIEMSLVPVKEPRIPYGIGQE
jgi:glyoxalase family protein